MPLECPICEIALTRPYIGEIDSECRSCRVRYASMLPRQARESIAMEVFNKSGSAEASRWISDVNAEYARRKKLAS